LLRRGLGLPDQQPAYAQALAQAVGRLPGPRAARAASVLHELHGLEQSTAELEAAARASSLARIQRGLGTLAEIVDAPPLSAAQCRSIVYEDVASGTPGRTWDGAVLRAEAGRLALLQRLLPALDQARLERRALYELFASHFGPQGRCDDVLEFYRVFTQQSPAQMSALMTGVGQPWAQEVFALRRRLAEHLDARLTEAPDAETLALDEGWLRDLVGSLPEPLEPWRSAAYGLQFLRGGPAGPGLVLNNVMTGHGWVFSRFCDLFEPTDAAGASLRELVRARIGRRHQGAAQVDIVGVFGMNANLHPRLSELELRYPGSLGSGPAPQQLSLRDVALVGDPRRRVVSAVRRRDGAPLRLVAHNFLFPAAAPNLYRFLCGLSEFINLRAGLWSTYLSATGRPFAGPRVLPRLTLGRVVLERRSWTWPTDQLPAPGGEVDWRDPLASLQAAERWRAGLGLPREGFFRFTPARSATADGPDWQEQMRSWALAARTARLRKPHYVCFDSVLLWSVLLKQLRSCPRGALTFHECLPATEEYAAGEAAEEYYVELDLRAPLGPTRALDHGEDGDR
ncbi:MAG: lantibiotic dehydratase, partial [Myxococcales bacterium]|nr:lantibiotic dehydratase [Myxococcales bacterium]